MPREGHTVRCDECIDTILRLKTARLTRMLLEEPYVPERLSERLVSDLDAGVALAASERLGGQLAGAAGQLAGAAGQLAGASAFDPTAEMAPVDVAPPVPTWDDAPMPERSVLTQSAEHTSDPSAATGDDWGEW